MRQGKPRLIFKPLFERLQIMYRIILTIIKHSKYKPRIDHRAFKANVRQIINKKKITKMACGYLQTCFNLCKKEVVGFINKLV